MALSEMSRPARSPSRFDVPGLARRGSPEVIPEWGPGKVFESLEVELEVTDPLATGNESHQRSCSGLASSGL